MATVAEVIAQTLAAYGTEKFFCLMGGDHELWYALEDAKIQIINCRSESAAVYAADGYARISGKPGFVYGQRGPGVANVAGALADPYWAKSPVISLTSSIAMDVRDRYEYQELDGLPLHVAVTKWNKGLSSPDRAAAMVRAAIRIATGVPPSPVHLEIPADMLTMETDSKDVYREEGLGHVNARRVVPDLQDLGRLVERLAKAERPLIVAGKGIVISEAWDELTRFAEALSIPVATSLGGKGAIDEMNDLAVGVIGRNSRKVGNDTVRGCDTVLAIGTRLGGLATHRWALPFAEKRLFHIDPDPQILGHNYQTEISVAADAKLALQAALAIVEERGLARGASLWTREVIDNIRTWRSYAATYARDQKVEGIHPAEVMTALREVMAPSDVIGADTGAHGGWVGGLFPVAAGKTMVRANGSLGWIFPGAIGAALADPSRRMVAVSGDGGMLYHIAEFETAMRYNIPVVVVVLNNACLASEYHSQKKHGRVVHEVVDFRDVDFAAVARAFGAYGVTVDKSTQLKDAITGALAANCPALIDVKVSREAQAPSANRDATRKV
jgi:acetolactate synthase-1/2/3 large subunit